MRRAALLAGVALVAVLVIGSGAYIASVALTPFTSVRVPASCTDATSHVPRGRAYRLPEGATGTHGTGTLLVSSPHAAVVITADYGHTPFFSTVSLVNRADGAVVRTLHFTNDVLAAAIDHGVLYLYDKGILLPLDAATGRTLHGLVRFDNYRALYESNGHRRMQTSAAITSVGFDGALLTPLNVHFATVVDGCYFP